MGWYGKWKAWPQFRSVPQRKAGSVDIAVFRAGVAAVDVA